MTFYCSSGWPKKFGQCQLANRPPFVAANNGRLSCNSCATRWGGRRTTKRNCFGTCPCICMNSWCRQFNSSNSPFIADDNGHLFPQYKKYNYEDEEDCEEETDDESEDEEGNTKKCKGKNRKPVSWEDVPKYYKNGFPRKSKKEGAKKSGPSISDQVNQQMHILRCKCIPVIWIYGLPSEETLKARRRYAKRLAKRLNFKFIDLDEQLGYWVKTAGYLHNKTGKVQEVPPGCPGLSSRRMISTTFGSGGNDQIFQRLVRISARMQMSNDDTLIPPGVVEYCKLVMLKTYPVKGYVLMDFPCCDSEAVLFENEIWPATCGIYFQEGSWSANKSVEPDPVHPIHFRRTQLYKECDVERTCERLGFKSIKVLNVEGVTRREHDIIDQFVDRCICALPIILSGQTVGIFPKCELTFLNNPNHPTILEAPMAYPPRKPGKYDDRIRPMTTQTQRDENEFFSDENIPYTASDENDEDDE